MLGVRSLIIGNWVNIHTHQLLVMLWKSGLTNFGPCRNTGKTSGVPWSLKKAFPDHEKSLKHEYCRLFVLAGQHLLAPTVGLIVAPGNGIQTFDPIAVNRLFTHLPKEYLCFHRFSESLGKQFQSALPVKPHLLNILANVRQNPLTKWRFLLGGGFGFIDSCWIKFAGPQCRYNVTRHLYAFWFTSQPPGWHYIFRFGNPELNSRCIYIYTYLQSIYMYIYI